MSGEETEFYLYKFCNTFLLNFEENIVIIKFSKGSSVRERFVTSSIERSDAYGIIVFAFNTFGIL